MRRVVLLLVFVVIVAGCLSASTPACRALARELQAEDRDCTCIGISEADQEVEDRLGDQINTKCRCTCTVGNTTTTVDIIKTN